MKYWFRICFEKECFDKIEAEHFCEQTTDDLWDSSSMSHLSTTIEEREESK